MLHAEFVRAVLLNCFLTQYGLFHLPRILANGNSQYLLPKGCYWQMCHTHYPFDPPVWLLSSNVRTFPIGRIQDNRTSSCLNAAVVSSIVLVNSACFTSVKELLYVYQVASTCNWTTCMWLSRTWLSVQPHEIGKSLNDLRKTPIQIVRPLVVIKAHAGLCTLPFCKVKV